MGVLKVQVFWGRRRRAEGSYLLRSLFFSFRLLLRLRDLQEAETRSEHHCGCRVTRVTVELWIPAELDKELQFAPLRSKPPWHTARLHAEGCACMWCWGRIRGVHIPPSHACPVCNLLLSIYHWSEISCPHVATSLIPRNPFPSQTNITNTEI